MNKREFIIGQGKMDAGIAVYREQKILLKCYKPEKECSCRNNGVCLHEKYMVYRTNDNRFKINNKYCKL